MELFPFPASRVRPRGDAPAQASGPRSPQQEGHHEGRALPSCPAGRRGFELVVSNLALKVEVGNVDGVPSNRVATPNQRPNE